MPIVKVGYTDKVLPEWIEHIVGEMPKIVAEALSSDGELGHLEPQEVAVMPGKFHELALNVKDVDITIFANDYPERKANLEERRVKVLEEVRKLLGNFDRNLSACVWILLAPGSYGEI